MRNEKGEPVLTGEMLVTLLHSEGYHAGARLVERLMGGISREAEMKYLQAFAQQSDFGQEFCREQLRAIWTAYCFHQSLDVDTADYDNDLLDLWNRISKAVHAVVGNSDWSRYDKFDHYMCAYLV